MTLKSSMAPVGASDARLLLLGSLPGDASLALQRYYAHPTNQFWRLLEVALREPLIDLGYHERLDRLATRGVALWDVVDRAERIGSLDGAIRGASHNALAEFTATHPRLEAIGFNGQTAARIGRGALADVAGLRLVDLPSSSAAYTLAFAAKSEKWQALAGFLDPA
ncbi:MAG: DNA-deoxyinosine glycosylase [Pseudomonadota bacterium]|nr:DNA-deoxyinosine glycosylase [Pseudomonadota bacterium]